MEMSCIIFDAHVNLTFNSHQAIVQKNNNPNPLRYEFFSSFSRMFIHLNIIHIRSVKQQYYCAVGTVREYETKN